MATQYYLKLYHEMLDDWKILSLSDGLKWRFVQCLLVAGELNQDGWLPEVRQFAARIRPMAPDALSADLSRLAAVELVELKIDDEGRERWFIPKFEIRQERTANAKRQAAFRRRAKEKKEAKKRKEEEIRLDIDVDIDTRNVTSNALPVTRNVTSNAHTKKQPIYTGHIENEKQAIAISEIASVVKDTLAPGFNEDRFESAAQAVITLDAVDRIAGFADWWQRNTYYSDNGKPALKTFIGEFQNYLDGVERNNGQSKAEIKEKQNIDAIDRAFDEMEAKGLI